MMQCRKHVPNIEIAVPDWDTPCTDVLGLPERLLMTGDEGYYRVAADGPLGNAAQDLNELYKGYLEPQMMTVIHLDGRREEHQGVRPDYDLLVRKLFGQANDPDLRIAFARCLEVIGAEPAAIIATGERVYAEYVQQEADRLIAETQAMNMVDHRYKDLLPRFLEGEVLSGYRNLLMRMTLFTGTVPEVMGIRSSTNEVLLAVKDIERMINRKFPAGAWRPDYVRVVSGRRYLSLPALMVFSLGPLRQWHWDNEDDEAIKTLLHCCHRLQYDLLNSTESGRKVLDKMLDGFMGSRAEPPEA